MDGTYQGGEEEDGQEHGLLPLGGLLSAGSREELTVVGTRGVPCDHAGERVGDDEGGGLGGWVVCMRKNWLEELGGVPCDHAGQGVDDDEGGGLGEWVGGGEGGGLNEVLYARGGWVGG